MNKALSKVLQQIAKDWDGHDFTGEALDDRWIEGLCPESIRYIEPRAATLRATVAHIEDPEARIDAELLVIATGQRVVLARFVEWLAKSYLPELSLVCLGATDGLGEESSTGESNASLREQA